MPLTLEQIQTFYNDIRLPEMLDDLVKKGYLTFEHPKKRYLLRLMGISVIGENQMRLNLKGIIL